MDIALNPDTHDVVITATETSFQTDPTLALAQALKIKLMTFKGELYYNPDYGVDYFGRILGKGNPKESVDVVLQQAILEENKVAAIVDYKSELLPTREFVAEFKVKTTFGTTTPTITLAA